MIHLIDEYSESPPIHVVAVPTTKNDFRSHILWRPAHSERAIRHTLRKSKVGELKVAPVVYEKIFRLEIPENDVQIVKIFEGQGDLRSPELRDLGIKSGALGPLNDRPEFASITQLHQKVDRALVLKVVDDSNQEGTIERIRQVLLIANVLNLLLLLGHVLLSLDFKRAKLGQIHGTLLRRRRNHKHPPKVSLSECSPNLQVLDLHTRLETLHCPLLELQKLPIEVYAVFLKAVFCLSSVWPQLNVTEPFRDGGLFGHIASIVPKAVTLRTTSRRRRSICPSKSVRSGGSTSLGHAAPRRPKPPPQRRPPKTTTPV
mmetsp:Transcript_6218/g.16035  ORF Transcript_6218/g.16035 Transcript_6218/m.16035 type:complete len:316 (-) Transcript_6218:8-955(-)